MKNAFLPEAHGEKVEFEEEALALDVQLLIGKMLREKAISQKDLAIRLGCTAARVSQYLNDGGSNMTIRTIAKIFYALECRASIACASLAVEESCAEKISPGEQPGTRSEAWLRFFEKSDDKWIVEPGNNNSVVRALVA